MKLLLPVFLSLITIACVAPKPPQPGTAAHQRQLEEEARENFYALKARERKPGQPVQPTVASRTEPPAKVRLKPFAPAPAATPAAKPVAIAKPAPLKPVAVAKPARTTPAPTKSSAFANLFAQPKPAATPAQRVAPPKPVVIAKATPKPAPAKPVTVVAKPLPPKPVAIVKPAPVKPVAAAKPAPLKPVAATKPSSAKPVAVVKPTPVKPVAAVKPSPAKVKPVAVAKPAPKPAQPTTSIWQRKAKPTNDTVYIFDVPRTKDSAPVRYPRSENAYARFLGKQPQDLTPKERDSAHKYYRD